MKNEILRIMSGRLRLKINQTFGCCSVTQSCSPLQRHGLQHDRLPYSSPTPGACPNSCPFSQWCHSTISSSVSPSPPAFKLSKPQGLFQWDSHLHIRWLKYWSFSFSISPFSEYSGLISFRTDWFDLLAVQGTRKSLLQHHSSKASILLHSAFFIVQLSYPHMTTGKTMALTKQTFVVKVISLFFNMLSGLVITFLSRNKLWLCSFPGGRQTRL